MKLYTHSSLGPLLLPGWERNELLQPQALKQRTAGAAQVNVAPHWCRWKVEDAVTVRAGTGSKSQPCHFLAMILHDALSLLPLCNTGNDTAYLQGI